MAKSKKTASDQPATPLIRQRRVSGARGAKNKLVAKKPSPEDESPRERIMKVAAHLFSTNGFVGTTMADIADAAGIRSPSLYYHFQDKADILGAIANLAMDVALSDSRRMVEDEALSTAERFYFLVHDLVFHLCESAYDLDCMFDPVFQRDEFRGVYDKLKKWLKDMEFLIKTGTAEGTFAPQNPRVAAYTVRGLIIAAIRNSGAYSEMDNKERAEYAAGFAVNGLMACNLQTSKERHQEA